MVSYIHVYVSFNLLNLVMKMTDKCLYANLKKNP